MVSFLFPRVTLSPHRVRVLYKDLISSVSEGKQHRPSGLPEAISRLINDKQEFHWALG